AQLETLNLLGELGDPAALPAILPLLAGGASEEAQRLRLRAVETLGRIPAPGAARPLLELFQKKGFLKGREPVGLRIAAARALAAQNTQEARECMALALEMENTEEVKAILRQSLVR
ncbi:MAG TPA: HEAT repeat domain-containing protein, partial [Holophaga sp.]|nr:HEAT repeat domain-containing protein [Holophaga sp.]